jgi:hypothetical protein
MLGDLVLGSSAAGSGADYYNTSSNSRKLAFGKLTDDGHYLYWNSSSQALKIESDNNYNFSVTLFSLFVLNRCLQLLIPS